MPSDSPNFDELIPELKDWNNGQGASIDVYLSGCGNFELAIAFRRLYWPDFVEHDNCVLLPNFSLKTYDAILKNHNGDRAEVEALLNHQHILDLFPLSDATTEAQIRYIGQTLQEVWTAKLKRDFPNRTFEVCFNDIPGLDLVNYQITFFQPSNGII